MTRKDVASGERFKDSTSSEGRVGRVGIGGRLTSGRARSEGREGSLTSDGREGSLTSDGKEGSLTSDGREGSLTSVGREGSLTSVGREGSSTSDGKEGSFTSGKSTLLSPGSIPSVKSMLKEGAALSVLRTECERYENGTNAAVDPTMKGVNLINI